MSNLLVSSPIHLALGARPSPISLTLIDEAISNAVAEASDLDWKAKLPIFKTPESALEFAKDVAAMANSAGGYVVYGVSETDGKAASRSDVDISESTQQRMIQAAQTHIRPLVTGISFFALQGSGLAGTGVLVMRIPPSNDAPHQVGPDGNGKVVFPYRNGAHTAFFREHELARAYHDRFLRREGELARAETLLAHVRANLGVREHAWIVVVAVPLARPVSSTAGVGREDVRKYVAAAAAASVALLSPGGEERFEFLRDVEYVMGAELHRRSRRWVVDSGPTGAYGVNTRAEFHDDGSLLLAVDQGAGVPDGDLANWMPIWRIESAIVDALALVDTLASARGLDGGWLLGIRLFPHSEGRPFSLVDFHRWQGKRGHGDGGHTRKIPNSRDLEGPFQLVEAEVIAPAEPADIVRAARELALEVVNQFACERLQLLGA